MRLAFRFRAAVVIHHQRDLAAPPRRPAWIPPAVDAALVSGVAGGGRPRWVRGSAIPATPRPPMAPTRRSPAPERGRTHSLAGAVAHQQVPERIAPDKNEIAGKERVKSKFTAEGRRLAFYDGAYRSYGGLDRHLAKLCTAGNVDEAVTVLEDMKGLRFQPAVETFNMVLSALAHTGRAKQAFKLYNEIKRRQLVPTERTHTSLFHAFAQAPGNSELALRLFKTLLEEDSPALTTPGYNALLRCLALADNVPACLEVLDTMTDRFPAVDRGCRPDVMTYTTVVHALQAKGDVATMLHLLQAMRRTGIRPDAVFVTTALGVVRQAASTVSNAPNACSRPADVGANAGDTAADEPFRTVESLGEAVVTVRQAMPLAGLSIQVVDVLAHVYAALGDSMALHQLLTHDMLVAKLAPDTRFINSMLKLHGGILKNKQGVQDILKMLDANLDTAWPDAHTAEAIIDACARTGDFAQGLSRVCRFNDAGIAMSTPVIATTLHHAFKQPDRKLKMATVSLALDWLDEHQLPANDVLNRVVSRGLLINSSPLGLPRLDRRAIMARYRALGGDVGGKVSEFAVDDKKKKKKKLPSIDCPTPFLLNDETGFTLMSCDFAVDSGAPPSSSAGAVEDRDLVQGIGAGDSYLHLNVLPADLANGMFSRVREEVPFQTMQHRGGLVPRLVCVMGDMAGDFEPIYRHPAEAQPATVHWTSVINVIREACSSLLQQQFNHALVQFYADGRDYISEHSDKTIDVRRGTPIVNFSLGATRVLVLRAKGDSADTPGAVQRISLPHNSLFVLGPETNRTFTHAIRQDKRDAKLKRPDELIEMGARISLTLRDVATFRDRHTGQLSGQGARRPDAPPLSPAADAQALLSAFSNENRDPLFDWDANYGRGFNTTVFDA